MDEDYLDSLLGDLENNSKLNSDFDKSVDVDSGIDLDLGDLSDISLEELDDLDGIDLSDLELDDIDFDDIDVTKLDAAPGKTEKEEDFNLDSIINEQPDLATDIGGIDETEEAIARSISEADDVFSDADNALFEDLGMSTHGNDENNSDTVNNNESDSFSDATSADSDMLQDLFGNNTVGDNSELARMLDSADELDELLGPSDEKTQAQIGGDQDSFSDDSFDATAPAEDNMDINALFESLGIDEDSGGNGNEYTKSENDLDGMFEAASMNMAADELAGIEDISENTDKGGKKGKKGKKKKAKAADGEKQKKSLSVILFGEPDAEEIQEAELAREKKEQKKLEKEEKKTKKAEQKAEKQAALKLKKEEDKKAKLEKKDKKKAEYEAELEEEKDQKQVPTPVVVIVFVIFALIGGLSYFGSKNFHYSEVIKKAADYFDRQRYRLAYDEVAGVEVKKDDEELRDRIYTVMYVERLYESYDNNLKLGRTDKALDALLRGLEKYEEHYTEAVELGISEDIDACRDKIITALADTYNLKESDAKKIMALDGKEYLDALNECCEGINTGE